MKKNVKTWIITCKHFRYFGKSQYGDILKCRVVTFNAQNESRILEGIYSHRYLLVRSVHNCILTIYIRTVSSQLLFSCGIFKSFCAGLEPKKLGLKTVIESRPTSTKGLLSQCIFCAFAEMPPCPAITIVHQGKLDLNLPLHEKNSYNYILIQ